MDQAKFEWSEANVTKLRELYAEGLSFGDITLRFEGLTRNAAIGKAHRLGLVGRRTNTIAKPREPRGPYKPRTPRIRKEKPKINGKRWSNYGSGLALVNNYSPQELVEVIEEINDLSVPLLELGPGCCHWPVGDKDASILFCGRQATIGQYCEWHFARGHRPSRQ